jgi:hypothetical protein
VAQGIRLEIREDFLEQLERCRGGSQGYELGEDLKAELCREYARYQLVHEQVKHLEREQLLRAEQATSEAMAQVNQLRRIGIVAMARKLLIALWRYVKEGQVPERAVFKAI